MKKPEYLVDGWCHLACLLCGVCGGVWLSDGGLVETEETWSWANVNIADWATLACRSREAGLSDDVLFSTPPAISGISSWYFCGVVSTAVVGWNRVGTSNLPWCVSPGIAIDEAAVAIYSMNLLWHMLEVVSGSSSLSLSASSMVG